MEVKDLRLLKQYKETWRAWTSTKIMCDVQDIRSWNNLPKLSNISKLIFPDETVIKNEFLKLVGNEKGKDLYAIDLQKAIDLTEDRINMFLAVSKRKRFSREQRGRYIIEYLHKTEPEILESDVEVFGNRFKGADGYMHNIKERGCRIKEVIMLPHKENRNNDKVVKDAKQYYEEYNKYET